MVRRFESQRLQAKMIFCSRKCKVLYYQGLIKPVNQSAFGVSLTIAKAFASGIDPWAISKLEAAF
jgi:hypothetical protein